MAQVVTEIFSLENAVFRAYLFYSSLLVLKMMSMSLLTGYQRFTNKAFANPEDGQKLKIKPRVDENVERIRRAHLNDIENLSIFYVIGFIYTLTSPTEYLAKSLYLAYTAARFMHTFAYILVIPQPARALSFMVGLAITGYMGVRSLLYFF